MENRQFHDNNHDKAAAFSKSTSESTDNEVPVFQTHHAEPGANMSKVIVFAVPYPYHIDEYLAHESAFNEHHGLSLK